MVSQNSNESLLESWFFSFTCFFVFYSNKTRVLLRVKQIYTVIFKLRAWDLYNCSLFDNARSINKIWWTLLYTLTEPTLTENWEALNAETNATVMERFREHFNVRCEKEEIKNQNKLKLNFEENLVKSQNSLLYNGQGFKAENCKRCRQRRQRWWQRR